jgi:acyl dehydratase
MRLRSSRTGNSQDKGSPDASPGLGTLYAKAAVSSVGPRAHTLPDTELRTRATVDRARLAEYDRVCGFAFDDALPATYPHMLAFPLQVRLMAGRSFPLPLPGLVHIANSITAHRRIDASETLDVRVRAERFVPHPKGAQVDLVAAVDAGGERVWDSHSTYLARGAKAPDEAPASRHEPVRESTPTGARVDTDGTPTATWRVDAGAGRRYAAVSGDVNPIHLHPWTAKAFGFPRAIAHGMWTAAHALAALQGRLPDALTYDVEFGRPLLLPSTVELRTRAVDGGWDLGVSSRGKAHLTAAIRRSVG